MRLNVPFYPNTEDDTHCYQASLRMVLKHFNPQRDFSWGELEKITAKAEGLWTWSTAGMVWMQKNGFEVLNVDMFDWTKFSEEGGSYLIKEYGNEVGQAQIKHSNIPQEMELAKILVKEVGIERRIPTKEDVKKLIEEGYLVICNVNSRKLNGREGYSGHAIVITGFDDTGFFIHDPGLPPMENRFVEYPVFEKAWAYPEEKAKNIEAYRLK
ncbi:C39 family peptidase [Candidatus Pacearchaeota archaeon]|nr:C39 family peptidase [Candidatus Pacearchaeota archaeon]